MFSVFDQTVQVNSNYSAVTVVYRGNHAGIIIETIDPSTQEKELRYADFLPASLSVGMIAAVIGPPVQGMVHLRRLHNTHMGLEELKKALHITSTSITYQAERNLVHSMIVAIINESRGNMAPTQFHVRGVAYSDNTMNSYSWVRNKLATININIPLSWGDAALIEGAGCTIS